RRSAISAAPARSLRPLSAPAAAFLPRLPGRSVPPLVVAQCRQALLAATRPPPLLLPLLAQQVQRTAHLLHRHFRIFPPAAAPCARPQRLASTDTRSGAASEPCSSCLRSASNRVHSSPHEWRAPRAIAETRHAPRSAPWQQPARWTE